MLLSKVVPFSNHFSHHYVFVWAGKNHSKMQRVEADLFENRGKISVFRQKQIPVDGAIGPVYVKLGGGGRPQVGEVTYLSIYSLILI